MPTVDIDTSELRKAPLSDAEYHTFKRVIKTGAVKARIRKNFHEDQSDSERATIESRLFRSIANDIYPIPEVVNPERKEKASTSLQFHLEAYHPHKYNIKWSNDHYDLLKTIEESVLYGGGLFANALPRGHGKSSIAEGGLEWAIFHGHKKYGALIAATSPSAKEMYTGFLTEIETNDLLMEDFPEICYPIRQLRGSYFRCKFQHLQGNPTRITLSAGLLILPHIEGSKSCNSVIQSASITGRIRGMKQTISTGETIRPDFVIVDDPQTDRSAKSPGMTAQREKIIQGTIRGLAGPQKGLTVVMPCTVIQRNDVAERFLDREKRPEWQGQRKKLLVKFPDNLDIWNKYNEIRGESFRLGDRGKQATEYYKLHREKMDAGAVVSWEERYNPETQISAIQFAMDLYFDDPVAFASEYQNDPLPELNGDGLPRISLEAKNILQRFSGYMKNVAPLSTIHLTGGVDIQGKIIYYALVAWVEDYGGIIVDHGTYPKQPLDYFMASEPSVGMADIDKNLSIGPQVFNGLEYLHKNIFSYQFITRDEQGGYISPSKILIDANWNVSADAVYGFCKQYESLNLYMPSHGKGIGAAMLPMESWSKKQGEIRGLNWLQKFATQQNNRGKHISYDTNFWKSLVAERLVAPKGSPNALLLPGEYSSRYQLLADHIAGEQPITTYGRGRYVDEWKLKPACENHWFDCIVMSAVGANIMGLMPHVITVNTPDGKISTAPAPVAQRKKLDPKHYRR